LNGFRALLTPPLMSDMKNIDAKIKSFYFILILTLIFIGLLLLSFTRPRNLQLHFLAVGEGDAILIETAAGQNILIDGGPNNATLLGLGRFLPFYDRQIDLLILTHPHRDHFSGLLEITRRYDVQKIMITGVNCADEEYLAWLKMIAENKIGVEIADHRGTMALGGGAELAVLFPAESLAGKSISNLNNSSIVAKLKYFNHDVLLTGDHEQILKAIAGQDLKAEILKVSHHGSKYASPKIFLQAVSPEQAVISVGKNSFGHPGGQVIADLKNLGAIVSRTDVSGDISFVAENQKWFRQERPEFWAWLGL